MSQRFRVRVLPGVLGYLPGRQLRGPEGLVGGMGPETLGIKKKKKHSKIASIKLSLKN